MRSGKEWMGIALALGGVLTLGRAQTAGAEQRVSVVFEGGHETEGLDRGRPVVLVAGALGVTPEVFRDAFSRVHPAHRDGGPTPDEARANKAALMDALAKYGVTNARLDEVSNYYRYRRDRGETWPTRFAKAFAVVQDGRVVRFEVMDPGEGYSSPPTVRVPGFPALAAKASLAFDRRFAKNGSIRSISITSP